MRKQTQLFMTCDDERSFTSIVAGVFPGLKVVDDNVWENPRPVVRESIELCGSRHAFLWSPEVIGVLPVIQRKDGRYEGPTSGVVIQYSRSLLKEEILLSGRIAVGVVENAPHYLGMRSFARGVWKLLLEYCRDSLVAIEPYSRKVIQTRVSGFVLGPNAREWCIGHEARVLKDRATENYFLPQQQGCQD